MSSYSFRIRFIKSPNDTINIKANSWEVELLNSSKTVVLCAREKEQSIHEAKELVLKSSGWASEQEAYLAGQKYLDVLKIVLARLRIGADFGTRSPQGHLFAAGLEMFEQQLERRVLNDAQGLMVYKTEPLPLFARVGQANLLRGIPQERFERSFADCINKLPVLNEREHLSFELYFASFFQQTSDARFLLLMMAIEALIEPCPRAPLVTQHVEHLMYLTRNSNELSKQEKDSLNGSLQWLLKQSIGQAGRELVSKRLGTRTYQDQPASSFFTHCYNTRSRLVHGANPFPSRDEISSLAANLEVFVSDILTRHLLDVEL